MAVIKIFDSKGVKTLVLSGNAADQPYDTPDEGIEIADTEDSESAD